MNWLKRFLNRLTYKKVFTKYNKKITDYLACWAFETYKKTRVFLTKWKPLKDWESDMLYDRRSRDESSTDMPLGYNYVTGNIEEGYLNLAYIDFFDYLPKEEIGLFKKNVLQFLRNNTKAPFSMLFTADNVNRIDDMGWYSSWESFANIITIKIIDNGYLEDYAANVTISLRNLSPSFLLVKFRFYLNDQFQKKINSICKKKYAAFSGVFRQFHTPWFMPKKFGRSFYTGNNARQKDIYELLSGLKWNVFRELKQYFSLHFERDYLFLPTFQTFTTNIRPDNSEAAKEFWNSVFLDFKTDYAPEYNTCVCWGYDCSNNEGICLSAYCGGDYSQNDSLPGIVQHELSDIYAVYLTATTLKRVALQRIANINVSISKAIRRGKTSKILKERVMAERELYYCYRFVSEFSDATIGFDDIDAFKSGILHGKSFTELNMRGLTGEIASTKGKVDVLLHFLNDAAEYGNAKSNLWLQFLMLFATIASLSVAIISLILTNKVRIIETLQQIIVLLGGE